MNDTGSTSFPVFGNCTLSQRRRSLKTATGMMEDDEWNLRKPLVVFDGGRRIDAPDRVAAL